MAIDKIKKVSIAVHKKHKIEFLEEMHGLEVLHIDKIEGMEHIEGNRILEEIELDDKEKHKTKIQKINSAISFMSKYKKPENLIQSFFPTKIFIDEKSLKEIKEQFSGDVFLNDILKISDEESRLKREHSQIETLIHELKPFLFIKDEIRSIKDTEACKVKTGLVSKEDFDKLAIKLADLKPVAFQYNCHNPKDVFLYLIYHRNIEKEIEGLFNRITFIEHSFSSQLMGQPQTEHDYFCESLLKIEKRLQKLDENAERLSRDIDKLKVIYDMIHKDLDIYLIQDNIKGTGSVVFLEGWIRQKDMEIFNKSLSKFKEVHVEYDEPDMGPDVPVSLNTPSIVKPFQMVVRLYALPRSFEIDPTMVLAPFFALFFALCLTDAGYGLMLVLLSLVLYKSRKIEKGSELLFKLMILSGLLTIIAGVLTGGFLGYSLNSVPFLKDLILLDLNSDTVIPGTEPPSITFLKIALLLGIVHVIAGILIRAYMKIRDGSVFSAIIDELNQVFLIISGSIFVGDFLSFIELEEGSMLLAVSGYVMLITSVIFILFIGRELRKPLPVIGKGLFEYYSFFSGTFGDILSYARLMALGMATGVTAKSVGMIAEMVFEIRIVGPVIALIIFVAGHLFMMIINALGSFIHTARLQYLEFFTKFYEGGGREFIPFKHNKKYIVFEDDIA